MLTVVADDKLYIPTFYQKGNGSRTKWKPEDCFNNFTESYLFPIQGDVEKYYEFLNVAESVSGMEKKPADFTLNRMWQLFKKRIEDTKSLTDFEFISLEKSSMHVITYFDDQLNVNNGLFFKGANEIPGAITVRSVILAMEQRFVAINSVLNDVPKSIAKALESFGEAHYKGNYAIIDLKVLRETGNLEYVRT